MHDDLNDDEFSQMYGREARPGRALDGATLKRPIAVLQLKEPAVVPPTMLARDAVEEMKRRRLACLVVVEGGKLVGIFTERDVLTRVASASSHDDRTLAQVMTHDPSTLTREHMIAYALNFMHVGGFRHVPVVDAQGRPVGVIGVRDILAYLADYFPAEVHNLAPPKQADHMPMDGG